MGLVFDTVWRASSKIGMSAQLGFLSQVYGSATVKGPPSGSTGGDGARDMAFKPILFVVVGPELFL